MARLTKIRIDDHEATIPDSYTKTQTNNLLNGKQDTLTAGNNITISNNVIEATGAGFATLKVKDETFWNAASYTVAPYDSVTVPITNGTVPSGYTFSGLRSFGSGDHHFNIGRVTPSSTVVYNPTNQSITVAANTNYTERVYLKIE